MSLICSFDSLLFFKKHQTKKRNEWIKQKFVVFFCVWSFLIPSSFFCECFLGEKGIALTCSFTFTYTINKSYQKEFLRTIFWKFWSSLIYVFLRFPPSLSLSLASLVISKTSVILFFSCFVFCSLFFSSFKIDEGVGEQANRRRKTTEKAELLNCFEGSHFPSHFLVFCFSMQYKRLPFLNIFMKKLKPFFNWKKLIKYFKNKIFATWLAASVSFFAAFTFLPLAKLQPFFIIYSYTCVWPFHFNAFFLSNSIFDKSLILQTFFLVFKSYAFLSFFQLSFVSYFRLFPPINHHHHHDNEYPNGQHLLWCLQHQPWLLQRLRAIRRSQKAISCRSLPSQSQNGSHRWKWKENIVWKNS